MLVLVIDTSGPDCGAGIYDSSARRLAGGRSETIGKGHAERLPQMVVDACRQAGTELKDIARIAVTVGPGSFTGIRVGVAMARGLALALGVPVVGVTTLQVVAAPHLGEADHVLALIDARREELYAQLFDRHGNAASAPAALSFEEARALGARNDAVMVGSGAAILQGAPSPQIDAMPLDLIGHIGAGLDPSTPARPLYIRGADAKPQMHFAVEHA